VRPNDGALEEQLEGILERKRPDVARILKDYGVPLLPVPETGSR